jgi:flagellar hook-basal body protein
MAFDSLYTGISGLNAYQSWIDTISNNIANDATTAFKGQRMTFADMFYQQLGAPSGPTQTSGGTNPVDMGLGVKVNALDTLFAQGGLETTGVKTDLALNGDGFFILRNANGTSSPVYTRDGAFSLNAEGMLYDPASGLAVQGYMANSSGKVTQNGTPGNIVVPPEPAKRRDHEGSVLTDGEDLVTLAEIPSLGARIVVRFATADMQQIVGVMLGGDDAGEMGAMQLSIASETVSQVAGAMTEELAKGVGVSPDGVRAALCTDAAQLPPLPFESFESRIVLGDLAPRLAIDFAAITLSKLGIGVEPAPAPAPQPRAVASVQSASRTGQPRPRSRRSVANQCRAREDRDAAS